MFQPAALEQALQDLLPGDGRIRRLLLALSGGLDSMVLLHACHDLQRQGRLFDPAGKALTLAAIHVNHGISERADIWQKFCIEQCEMLGISLHCDRLSADFWQGTGSPETRAREERYRCFAGAMDSHTALMTAHHADDQIETLFLRLIRGAGPGGLAGIPGVRSLADGLVLRPLLAFDRAALARWAQQRQLAWIEDESNRDTGMDRNFLRHELLPLMDQRWPGWRDNARRSAALCAESHVLNRTLAQQDLMHCLAGGEQPRIDLLLRLDEARRRNCLRHWLQDHACPEPGGRQLQRMAVELLQARDDGRAEVRWQGWQLRCFRRRLHLLRDESLLPLPEAPIAWDPSVEAELPLPGNGQLQAREHIGGNLKLPAGAHIELRYRRAGDRCRLPGRPGKSLKQLFQESGVPPWQRDRIPLLWVDGELAWIGGFGPCDGFVANKGEVGWSLFWRGPESGRGSEFD